MRQMPLYDNIQGRIVVYWLSNVGVSLKYLLRNKLTTFPPLTDPIFQFGAGPLILSWINEICSADTEKRALLIAMGNDLAYVVQAVVSLLLYSWKERCLTD